jgi:hypothetical protein
MYIAPVDSEAETPMSQEVLDEIDARMDAYIRVRDAKPPTIPRWADYKHNAHLIMQYTEAFQATTDETERMSLSTMILHLKTEQALILAEA